METLVTHNNVTAIARILSAWFLAWLFWAMPFAFGETFVELRVSSPGDYPPFAVFNPIETTWKGADVTLIEHMARDWHMSVVWVKSSWPMLMTDLTQQNIDIAVGGIGDTPARRQVALMSPALLDDGKVAMGLCSDTRFRDLPHAALLMALNKPSVRVVENPGGTNQAFVTHALPNATLLTVPQGQQVTELTARRADVFITDGVESQCIAATYPTQLCPLNANNPFTRDTKVWLIHPKRADLQHRIAQWIEAHPDIMARYRQAIQHCQSHL